MSSNNDSGTSGAAAMASRNQTAIILAAVAAIAAAAYYEIRQHRMETGASGQPSPDYIHRGGDALFDLATKYGATGGNCSNTKVVSAINAALAGSGVIVCGTESRINYTTANSYYAYKVSFVAGSGYAVYFDIDGQVLVQKP
jgi:hypothetical protein